MTRAIAIAAVLAAACGSPAKSAPDANGAPDASRAPDANRAPDAAAAPDAPASPDAAPVALACLGSAPATAVADPLVVTGKVFAIADYHVSALEGVTVTVRKTSDDGALASGTTGADGAFAISIASGGHAPDAYFLVDDGVHRPTYAYAGAPLTAATDALLIVADDAELARWYTDAGDTWDASKRTMIAAVTDCEPKSIEASAAAAPMPAKLVYYDPVAQRWDPSLASSANGFVLLTGADVTETITATAGTSTFPAHAFPTHAGAITLAVVPPTL